MSADPDASTSAAADAAAAPLDLHQQAIASAAVALAAEESLGRPVGDNRHDVELALLACHWLGSAVLRPVASGHDHVPWQRVR